MSSQWTVKRALFCLIGSSCATLLVSVGGFMLYRDWKIKRSENPDYKIVSIVQTSAEREALKTAYLAELLNLSVDEPSQLYALDVRKAQSKLLQSPLICDAKIRRVPPGTLYIDYTVRKPVALLVDYANIAIDREGFLFPVVPFLSPKQLPEIYLGLPSFGASEDLLGRKGGLWQTPLENRHLSLAWEVWEFLQPLHQKEGLSLQRIDVSNAFASSLGQREIVLKIEDELILPQEQGELVCLFPKLLRLTPKDYRSQMNHFLLLRKNMLDDYKRQLASQTEGGRFSVRIIDLRIPQLAFIDDQK